MARNVLEAVLSCVDDTHRLRLGWSYHVANSVVQDASSTLDEFGGCLFRTPWTLDLHHLRDCVMWVAGNELMRRNVVDLTHGPGTNIRDSGPCPPCYQKLATYSAAFDSMCATMRDVVRGTIEMPSLHNLYMTSGQIGYVDRIPVPSTVRKLVTCASALSQFTDVERVTELCIDPFSECVHVDRCIDDMLLPFSGLKTLQITDHRVLMHRVAHVDHLFITEWSSRIPRVGAAQTVNILSVAFHAQHSELSIVRGRVVTLPMPVVVVVLPPECHTLVIITQTSSQPLTWTDVISASHVRHLTCGPYVPCNLTSHTVPNLETLRVPGDCLALARRRFPRVAVSSIE
jgi:hypothetical protein